MVLIYTKIIGGYIWDTIIICILMNWKSIDLLTLKCYMGKRIYRVLYESSTKKIQI